MSILRVKGVRSYGPENAVEFDLSKRVNLIYGQNGSGKSTVSGYFYKPNDSQYSKCTFLPDSQFEYLVFNQDYIDDTFHSATTQPGIFTLNSSNADIQFIIDENIKKIKNLKSEIAELNNKLREREDDGNNIENNLVEKIWSESSAVRRAPVASLANWMTRKKTFFHKIKNHTHKLEFTLEQLNDEFNLLETDKEKRHIYLNFPDFITLDSQELSLLSIPLIISSDSQLSAVINMLGNGDWVKKGESYLSGNICPFCQKTLDIEHFKNELGKLFDESYKETVLSINSIGAKYASWKEGVKLLRTQFESSEYISGGDVCYELLSTLELIYKSNSQKIERKVLSPSSPITLDDVENCIEKLKENISKINNKVAKHNQNIDNYDFIKNSLENKLLSYLRNCNDEYFIQLDKQLKKIEIEIASISSDIDSKKSSIETLTEENRVKSSKIVNIEGTINKINTTLKSLGVTGFEIVRHSPDKELYRLQRGDDGSYQNVFRTLSEGEKTLISFLYFLELCNGSSSKDNVINNRMIVIDDPISSLSHNFIYEISAMIYHELISKKIADKFLILTHNLFFFQELIITASTDKNAIKNWQLYRITKNEYSQCQRIEKEDVLNEYQSLWQTLKDARAGIVNPIILPNIMRNILEYYFSFACKKEKLREVLNDLSQKYSDHRYNSFYRFINRNSHADGRNITNLAAIDVTSYIEMFERIFTDTQDHEHFIAMMGENDFKEKTA